MTVETINALSVTRTIKADPQAVWNAWTQPEQMKHWTCPAPGAAREITTDCEIDQKMKILIKWPSVTSQVRTCLCTI